MKLIECKGSHNIYKVMKEVADVSEKEIKANSVDAAVEKHVPQYEIEGDKIVISVNHVMDDDHYIEWVMAEYDNMDTTRYFQPGEVAKFEVDYVPGMKLYAYCNKHGLWKKEVTD